MIYVSMPFSRKRFDHRTVRLKIHHILLVYQSVGDEHRRFEKICLIDQRSVTIKSHLADGKHRIFFQFSGTDSVRRHVDHIFYTLSNAVHVIGDVFCGTFIIKLYHPTAPPYSSSNGRFLF